MFKDCPATIPYWLDFDTSEERNYSKDIQTRLLNKELTETLNLNSKIDKRLKV
jgi:hypothetical protein